MLPKVSVITVTYNHENFIAQAIESVLMQHFEEPLEMIIAEDCSTDRTREIVQHYQKKYPDKIKLILNPTNIGAQKNFAQIVSAAKGQYVAFLDGDDYWTEPDKLKKQVEYMEQNPDVAICWHKVLVISEEGEFEPYCSHRTMRYIGKRDIDELFFLNYLPTSSIMYRNHNFAMPGWYYNLPMGDWPFSLLNAHRGSIFGMDEMMGVYRVHRGATWSVTKKHNEIRNYRKYLKMLIHFNRETQGHYMIVIYQAMFKFIVLLYEKYRVEGRQDERNELKRIIDLWQENLRFKLANIHDKGKLVVFGTGGVADQACLMLENIVEIDYFVDNDRGKWGSLFHGKPVYSPDRLMQEDLEKLFILIGSSYIEEITEQLLGMGLCSDQFRSFVFQDEVEVTSAKQRKLASNIHMLECFLAKEERKAQRYAGT